MASVVELTVAGAVAPWQSIGLHVVDGVSWIGGIGLRFIEADGATTIESWTLAGSATPAEQIDGLITHHRDDVNPQRWDHPLGATSFDHVVVMTSSLERTCGAIESATGAALKRVREVGPVRQGFHRLGPMIVEVVESDRVVDDKATFWGFVLIVDDIHEAAATLGPDLLSPPKPAVQPGRFIASFRPAAGLGLPIALMSPDTR
jgi:hypothetical protein